MTGAESAGDLVTGALIAGAVEGRSGERRGHGGPPGLCLNCGTALIGSYCHRCGQPGHIHRTLSAIWHDIAHGVLHFEGKIWSTLPLLVWRPGELTRRFVQGERARFISPIALFLFSVFLMFATFGLIGAHLELNHEGDAPGLAQTEIVKQRTEAEAELARLDKKIAETEAKGQNSGDLRRERASLSGLVRFWQGGPTVLSEVPKDKYNFNTGIARLDEGLAKASENPNLVLYKLQSNAYKFSWALIPISTPLVWLMFAWRRRFKVYDHAVFVTYSLAFMSLLVIVLSLLRYMGVASAPLIVAATFIPPIHMYRQMRGAYEIGRVSAFIRTSVLLFFAMWALIAYLLLLLALGVVG